MKETDKNKDQKRGRKKEINPELIWQRAAKKRAGAKDISDDEYRQDTKRNVTPKSDSRSSNVKKAGDEGPYGKKPGAKRPYTKRADAKGPYSKEAGEKRSYTKRADANGPYSKEAGEKGPYTKRSGAKGPYSNEAGEKGAYTKRADAKGPYTKRVEGKGPYAKKTDAKRGETKGPYVKKTEAGSSDGKKTGLRKPGARNTETRRGATKKPALANTPVADGPVRLNKYIAQAGIAARRKADELISEGRVKINDKVVTEMGIKVSPGDVVEVNGLRISPATYDYILLHKPTNIITSNLDEKERRVVIDLIEDEKLKDKGLFPVGRLDRNTTGVLLITNDGELAHRLMHPSYEIEKLYVVRTQDNIQPHELDKLMAGIEIGGEKYTMDEVAYTNLPKKNELGVSLHEGKNRHIRKMMEALGHKVTRLERVRYAGLTTEDVRPGKWRRLDSVEIRRLRRLVKLR